MGIEDEWITWIEWCLAKSTVICPILCHFVVLSGACYPSLLMIVDSCSWWSLLSNEGYCFNISFGVCPVNNTDKKICYCSCRPLTIGSQQITSALHQGIFSKHNRYLTQYHIGFKPQLMCSSLKRKQHFINFPQNSKHNVNIPHYNFLSFCIWVWVTECSFACLLPFYCISHCNKAKRISTFCHCFSGVCVVPCIIYPQ